MPLLTMVTCLPTLQSSSPDWFVHRSAWPDLIVGLEIAAMNADAPRGRHLGLSDAGMAVF
jgi:hypothetical protein